MSDIKWKESLNRIADRLESERPSDDQLVASGGFKGPIPLGLYLYLSQKRASSERHELAARLEKERLDAQAERDESRRLANHRRLIEFLTMIAFMVLVAVAVPASIWVLVDDKVPAEKKTWASNLISVLVGSLMGFLGRGADPGDR